MGKCDAGLLKSRIFNEVQLFTHFLTMHSIGSTYLKSKVLLLLTFVLCLSFPAFSQEIGPKIFFAGIEMPRLQTQITSRDSILDNPVFSCEEKLCRVMSFAVSIAVDNDAKSGKKNLYFGPFAINGNKLTKKVLDLIKQYDDQTSRSFSMISW